jgi:EAL domain-containing protein (putative c-di-GMP-specific phosphodiesterase class I)
MNKLRRFGLTFAVDDAGSGYAGVRQLVSLQPEWIKIDRSIVSKLDSDTTRRAAVRSLAQFAQDAGMSVIAEGLETETERLVLEHLGVGFAQGYLVGRPAPLTVDLLDVTAHVNPPPNTVGVIEG